MTKPDHITSISIDLETFSDVDIKKSGVYKYADSPKFEILLFSYSIDGSDVEVIDLAQGETLPSWLIGAIVSTDVIKWAFNATFERICLSKYIRTHYPNAFTGYGAPDDTTNTFLSPISWRCSMVWSAYLGLPLSLEGVGAVLGLEQQKMKEGKALIKYFCTPCAPTKTNGGRTRNMYFHDKEKWDTFKKYNIRDVEVEQAIQKKLSRFPVPASIWKEYHKDQEINDRGILLDMTLVKNAIDFDALSKDALISALKDKTKLDNPNSVLQMRDWLEANGIETDTLDKKAIADLIKTVPSDVADVLKLRQQLAKSSVKKYQAMENAACSDMRARGMFQFYGANRTGRWAGRLIQLQNLPQNHMDDLRQARELVRLGDYEALTMLYDDIPDTLSQLIRTAFIARPGYMFYVADFAAIEARVIAAIAKETWRQKAFRDGLDIYCASASKMFNCPVEKHGINSHLRQKGKIAELALGYGGSVGALKAMGAIDMGHSEEELQPLVDAWREANPNIVTLWWDVDSAVKNAVKMHSSTETHGIIFTWRSGMLFITLPSGRKLTYIKPRIGENKFGGESVTYEGIGATKKWERLESYGPKFVENIVQAVSRDLLMNAMMNLPGAFICGHIHDELLIECTEDTPLTEICAAMAKNPSWFPDILLRADGYITPFYKKD
ncbi:MAG: DNA polymerase [Butyrivibrio sp.]|nr:DNA polymerase [Butyrivibrio sp.]